MRDGRLCSLYSEASKIGAPWAARGEMHQASADTSNSWIAKGEEKVRFFLIPAPNSRHCREKRLDNQRCPEAELVLKVPPEQRRQIMFRLTIKGMVFLCLCMAGGALSLTAAEAEKTHKDLVEYVLNAQKLGLKEDEIKQNAVKAGWDKGSLDQALTIAKYLNTTGKGAAKTGSNPGHESLPGGPVLSNSPSLPGGYKVGPGDEIGILIWKEPEASVPQTMVRADGKVTLPLVKEVSVAGMTPTELEKFLADKYAAFISGADVTVVVKAINSRKVYLIGAVKKEGAMPLLGPMTVLQAITEAGGPTDYAKRTKIYVLRSENGKQIRLPFDYKSVIRGEHQEQNIALQPGDSVIIPH